MVSTLFLVLAILLFLIAGFHWAGVVTINEFDVMAFVAFGLASFAASFLPWSSITVGARR